MKKRNGIKLACGVATLALCLGVMGVGVFAATKQTVNIGTTVSFTAK